MSIEYQICREELREPYEIVLDITRFIRSAAEGGEAPKHVVADYLNKTRANNELRRLRKAAFGDENNKLLASQLRVAEMRVANIDSNIDLRRGREPQYDKDYRTFEGLFRELGRVFNDKNGSQDQQERESRTIGAVLEECFPHLRPDSRKNGR